MKEYKSYSYVRENEINVIVQLPDGSYDYIPKSNWITLEYYVDNL